MSLKFMPTLIPGAMVADLKIFRDSRGHNAELFRVDWLNLPTPRMAYMSFTLPGATRGPHEHEHQTDYFVFFGPGDFKVFLWKKDGDHILTDELILGSSRPAVLMIPPGVVHGYKNISPHLSLAINLPDQLYKGENQSQEVDEIRWENNPNSPFIIQ